MSEVLISGLRKTFGRRNQVVAVDGVDLEVSSGDLLVLLGPSGCGKTTLLRCVAGLERPNQGRITVGGVTFFDYEGGTDLAPHKRDYGMVFQNYALWPHLTVRKNVEYPLRAKGLKDQLKDGRARGMLELVRCDHLEDRLPAELSGGQQQRIALARALAPNPAVLLLDEPLSNLDALLRIELRAQLRAVHRSVGYTGVYVTHDQAEALSLATRIAVMKAGKVEQLATPEELYRSPATEYVAEFLGVRNGFPLTRSAETWTADVGQVRTLPPGVALDPSASHSLYVRPEDVIVRPAGWEPGPGDGPFVILEKAEVVDRLYGGLTSDIVLEVGGATVFATTPGSELRVEPGETVQFAIPQDDVLIYTDERLVTNRVEAAA